MNIEYHSEEIPARLTAQLKTGQLGSSFRRRSVMTNAGIRWELVCCTIERLSPGAAVFEPTPSRRYTEVLLYEDLLTEEECLTFANDLHAGHGRIGECELDAFQNPQWQSQLLPVNNEYMSGAGMVVSVGVSRRVARPQIRALLAPGQPYYPDLDEAGRDWLPFSKYYGEGDGRNDRVTFLLPETRAFVASAAFVEPGLLEIKAAGAQVDTLDLLIKGAYWEHGAIHHFEEAVKESTAIVRVPEEANRLEYYLLDAAGTAFDFHREDRSWPTQACNRLLGVSRRSLEGQVREALAAGEGTKIEFKPFVEPNTKRFPGGTKSKLHEVVITAVAFANSEGGHVYLGVDDDCVAAGIEAKLCEWAGESSTPDVIGRYLGALNSHIKSVVVGELALEASHVWIDGHLIAVISVSAAARRPITIRQDHCLYARKGASNQKVPPDQWRTVLEPVDNLSGPARM